MQLQSGPLQFWLPFHLLCRAACKSQKSTLSSETLHLVCVLTTLLTLPAAVQMHRSTPPSRLSCPLPLPNQGCLRRSGHGRRRPVDWELELGTEEADASGSDGRSVRQRCSMQAEHTRKRQGAALAPMSVGCEQEVQLALAAVRNVGSAPELLASAVTQLAALSLPLRLAAVRR